MPATPAGHAIEIAPARGWVSGATRWWEALVDEDPRGLVTRLARLGLRGLALPYGAGLALNLALYEQGRCPRTRPPLPVVSVGNLSLGGTGKSPTVAYLARRLLDRGVVPGVVLRGGGPLRRALELVSDGSARRREAGLVGDEATMLAEMLPSAPVAVGKRRERVIELLRRRTGAQVALLDDGFQYFRMERLLDLVLVDATQAGRRQELFPAGRLREPWSHLRRAHQLWITHADQVTPAELARLEDFLAAYFPERPAVLTRHRLTGLRGAGGHLHLPADLHGRRLLAVSGLGNPGAFEESLRQAGAEVLSCRFPDHYPYSPRDLRAIHERQRQAGAEVVVLTDKDAVKLPVPAASDWWVAECALEILRGQDQVEEAVDLAVAAAREYAPALLA